MDGEFAQANRELARRRGNARSWYDKVIAEIDEERKASLDEALASAEITNRAIALVLERWGFTVKDNTIGMWRRSRGLR